jgi:hypothetical protein
MQANKHALTRNDSSLRSLFMSKLISPQPFHVWGIMPAITVRNLPDSVHRALRLRAALHGRSTEAEVCDTTPFVAMSLVVINPWDAV